MQMANATHLIQNHNVMGFCEPVKAAMRKSPKSCCASNGTEPLIVRFRLDLFRRILRVKLSADLLRRGFQIDYTDLRI